jgi:hypothetical protein
VGSFIPVHFKIKTKKSHEFLPINNMTWLTSIKGKNEYKKYSGENE